MEKRQFRAGCVASFGISIFMIASMIAGGYVATGRPVDLSTEWSFLLLHVLLVATPFLLLTALGVTARVPWAVGLALTGLFWGYALFDLVFKPGQGANIGLGLIALLWPFVVAAGALAAAKLTNSLPDPSP